MAAPGVGLVGDKGVTDVLVPVIPIVADGLIHCQGRVVESIKLGGPPSHLVNVRFRPGAEVPYLIRHQGRFRFFEQIAEEKMSAEDRDRIDGALLNRELDAILTRP